MNCFQHIPESCGALHSPCGGAPQQRGPLTPQTQTRPNRLHTHTHPPKRLAHPRSPIPPLSTLTSRATHAHPTSPRSTGFCAIWDCISSSSLIPLDRQSTINQQRGTLRGTPEALAHSPSQMPLSCPVAPISQRELHKDGGGGSGGVARKARAARAPKVQS